MYTDSAEHPLSWFKAVYRDATITEENYQEEYDKGLYKFIPGLEIIPGWQKITFTYYADDAKILAIESVPIMYDGPKGETGEQGPRAPQYFGLFKPASPEEGDWYLDATTGYVQEYRSGAWHNLSYESNSSKYMAAINDAMGSLQLSDETLPMVKAMTAWINNLTASYAFIDSLFGNKITLQKGGVFKSENYNGTVNNGVEIDEVPKGTPVKLDNNSSIGTAIDSYGNLNSVKGVFIDAYVKNGFIASTIHKVKRYTASMINTSSDSALHNFFYTLKYDLLPVLESLEVRRLDYFLGDFNLYIKANDNKEVAYKSNTLSLITSGNKWQLFGIYFSRVGNLDDGRIDGGELEASYDFSTHNFKIKVYNSYPSLEITNDNAANYTVQLDVFL